MMLAIGLTIMAVAVVLLLGHVVSSRRNACPECGEKSVKFDQIIVLHEEEPPMFGRWVCESCGAATDVRPTRLSIDAAKELIAEGEDNEVLRAIVESEKGKNDGTP